MLQTLWLKSKRLKEYRINNLCDATQKLSHYPFTRISTNWCLYSDSNYIQFHCKTGGHETNRPHFPYKRIITAWVFVYCSSVTLFKWSFLVVFLWENILTNHTSIPIVRNKITLPYCINGNALLISFAT